jgi:predicted RNase H-like HicB family nuclease
MPYTVVFERALNGWGAYVLELPGLGVAGTTFNEVRELIEEAIPFHLEGMGGRAAL